MPQSKFSNYQTIHFREFLESQKHGDLFYGAKDSDQGSVNTDVQAEIITSFTNYEDSCFLYSYLADGKEYAFVWITPYDEFHRALSKRRTKEWYDDLTVGSTFQMRYKAQDPCVHVINQVDIKIKNSIFIGTK